MKLIQIYKIIFIILFALSINSCVNQGARKQNEFFGHNSCLIEIDSENLYHIIGCNKEDGIYLIYKKDNEDVYGEGYKGELDCKSNICQCLAWIGEYVPEKYEVIPPLYKDKTIHFYTAMHNGGAELWNNQKEFERKINLDVQGKYWDKELNFDERGLLRSYSTNPITKDFIAYLHLIYYSKEEFENKRETDISNFSGMALSRYLAEYGCKGDSIKEIYEKKKE